VIRRQEIRLCEIIEVQAEPSDARQKREAGVFRLGPLSSLGKRMRATVTTCYVSTTDYIIQAHAYNIQHPPSSLALAAAAAVVVVVLLLLQLLSLSSFCNCSCRCLSSSVGMQLLLLSPLPLGHGKTVRTPLGGDITLEQFTHPLLISIVYNQWLAQV
jgi:hypothetical protein